MKPCPFCGSKEVHHECEFQGVYCPNCGTIGPRGDVLQSDRLEAQVQAWNSRHPTVRVDVLERWAEQLESLFSEPH